MKNKRDLAGLMTFAQRAEWADAFEDVRAEHFGMALDTLDLEYDDLLDLLDDQWVATLWGCAFEDFLTRRATSTGCNVVDDYLSRRNARENVETTAYMMALQASFMSLYEVSDIVSGLSFRARDLILGGEPVLVHETSATHALHSWEKIAARLVHLGERTVIGGGMLPFSQEAATMLVRGLNGGEEEDASQPGSLPPIDEAVLRGAAPLFTTAWLLDALPKALGDMPHILNSDGEEPVFHQYRFPLATGVRQSDITTRLNGVTALSLVRARCWDWLEKDKGKPALMGKDVPSTSVEELTPEGRIILGHIDLKGRFLILTTNSVSRAARATTMLDAVLGERLLAPAKRIETLDDANGNGPDAGAGDAGLAPELATSLVHGFLDKQYRRTLDEPVPMLAGLSPRDAAAKPAHRAKAADWLKYLETQSARSKYPNDPMARYDFTWMWKELRIEDLRR